MHQKFFKLHIWKGDLWLQKFFLWGAVLVPTPCLAPPCTCCTLHLRPRRTNYVHIPPCPDEVTLVKYEEKARFDALWGRGYLGQATNWAKNQDFPAGPLEGAERHATMPSGVALTHSPLIVIIINLAHNLKTHETEWKPTKIHEKRWNYFEKPWKPTKNHEKPWNYLEKPWKPTKTVFVTDAGSHLRPLGKVIIFRYRHFSSLTRGHIWDCWAKWSFFVTDTFRHWRGVTFETVGQSDHFSWQTLFVTDAGSQLIF